MKAIGYIRVSTEEQAQSGLSLDNQREKIAALAGLHDWNLVGIVEDPGFSAGTTNRPGLQEVLSMVRSRKVKAVIIYKLDRLTRNQKDLLSLLETFNRFGVRLVSVSEQLDTSSASGRFFISMLGGISEWEKAVISERTEVAINQLRKDRKKFTRHPPLGWRFTSAGKMVQHDSEQQTLQIIQELHRDGLSLRKIGDELVRRGRTPRSGREWSTSVIRNAVRTAME